MVIKSTGFIWSHCCKDLCILGRVHTPISCPGFLGTVVVVLKKDFTTWVNVAIESRTRMPFPHEFLSRRERCPEEFHLYPLCVFPMGSGLLQRLTASRLASESAVKSPVPSNSSIATFRQTSMNHWLTMVSGVMPT